MNTLNEILLISRKPSPRKKGRHVSGFWEFLYCTRGKGCFYFDGSTMPYEKGDIVIIPPGCNHENRGEESFANIHLHMKNAELSASAPFLVHDDPNHFVLDAFTGALYHFSAAPEKNSAVIAAYGSLITALVSTCQEKPEKDGLVADISRSILKEFRNPDYDLERFLHSFPFSYDYIRKLFKRKTGITPHQYLLRLRLQYAAKQLSIPNGKKYSISEITVSSGFRDPFYFSRMFKKHYGVSPNAYRKQNKQ